MYCLTVWRSGVSHGRAVVSLRLQEATCPCPLQSPEPTYDSLWFMALSSFKVSSTVSSNSFLPVVRSPAPSVCSQLLLCLLIGPDDCMGLIQVLQGQSLQGPTLIMPVPDNKVTRPRDYDAFGS